MSTPSSGSAAPRGPVTVIGGGGGGDDEQAQNGDPTLALIDIHAHLISTFGNQGPMDYGPLKTDPEAAWDAISAHIAARLAEYDVATYRVSAQSNYASDFTAALAQTVSDATSGGSPCCILLPAGQYELGALQEFQLANTIIMGSGMRSTHIKMANGANLDCMLRAGYAPSETDSVNGVILSGFTLDGNNSNQSSGSGGLLEVSNTKIWRVMCAEMRHGFDRGLIVDTHSATIGASATDRGLAHDVLVRACEGEFAAEIRGAKNDQFDQLMVINNGRAGLRMIGSHFQANPDPNDNKELTQCQLTNFRIHDNGSSTAAGAIGLVLDNTTRVGVSSGHINFNPGGAIEFRRTLGTQSEDGSNQDVIENIECRNNGSDSGCAAIIGTQNSGDLTNAVLSNIRIQGNHGIADQIGIHLEGVDEVTLMGCGVRLTSGTGVWLENSNVQVLGLECNSNGAATPSALVPHGLHITGGRGSVIGYRGRNQKTNGTHAGRELYIDGSPTGWTLVALDLKAAASVAGFEFQMATATARRATASAGTHLLRDDRTYLPTLTPSAGAGQTMALPDDALLTGTCLVDGAAGAMSFDAISPFSEGARVDMVFQSGSNVTINHNAGSAGAGDVRFAGAANVVGSATKGIPFAVVAGNWQSPL